MSFTGLNNSTSSTVPKGDTQSRSSYFQEPAETEGCNKSSNSSSIDYSGYFDMPNCVTDEYLQALDGGDESNAALRQISSRYGPEGKALNTNCNHNPAKEEDHCACAAGKSEKKHEEKKKPNHPEDPCKCGIQTYEEKGCCDDEDPYEGELVDKKPVTDCGCCVYQEELPDKKPSVDCHCEEKK